MVACYNAVWRELTRKWLADAHGGHHRAFAIMLLCCCGEKSEGIVVVNWLESCQVPQASLSKLVAKPGRRCSQPRTSPRARRRHFIGHTTHTHRNPSNRPDTRTQCSPPTLMTPILCDTTSNLALHSEARSGRSEEGYLHCSTLGR